MYVESADRAQLRHLSITDTR
eukprot:COSAG06_NODE_75748_length_128_cov_24.965517_1_plen_20_part_10